MPSSGTVAQKVNRADDKHLLSLSNFVETGEHFASISQEYFVIQIIRRGVGDQPSRSGMLF